LYFGDPEQPFTKLMAFVDGYSLGYEMGRRGDSTSPKDLVPPGFEAYVREYFHVLKDTDTKGWRRRIQEATSSEQEAFGLFFQLLDEYEAGKSKTG
jgi:hypothetical protein